MNVVKYLLSSHKEGAGRLTRDLVGNLPLPLSCQDSRQQAQRNATPNLTGPHAVKQHRSDDCLPLHLALYSEMPDSLLCRILRLYPEAG
jgi:hypothetical protein